MAACTEKGGRLLVSDACWYLHLYDEEKKKIYEAHDAAMWKNTEEVSMLMKMRKQGKSSAVSCL